MPAARGARVLALTVVCLVLAGAVHAAAATEVATRTTTLRVASDAEFATATQALRRSGGTIVLRPRLYRELVIRWRTGKPLRIVGTRGARIGRVVFDGARRVSLGRVTIAPVGDDALVDVRGSRNVVLHDLVVTARGTRHSATVRIPDSR